jgi:hypothetical protein
MRCIFVAERREVLSPKDASRNGVPEPLPGIGIPPSPPFRPNFT